MTKIDPQNAPAPKSFPVVVKENLGLNPIGRRKRGRLCGVFTFSNPFGNDLELGPMERRGT